MTTHKIMILGDPKVGKTAIKHCCLGLQSEETGPDTVFEMVTVSYYACKIDVWDLNQPLYYDQLPDSMMYDVQGVILVYDIGRLGTFHNLPNWLDKIRAINLDKHIPVVIVGNKVDIRQWSADATKSGDAVKLISQLAELYERDIPYFEVSSYRKEQGRKIPKRLMQLVCEDFDYLDNELIIDA